jgi:hypothetical protein
MKSFIQYIIEVATEVPKNPRFHVGSHSTDRDDNTSSHQYDYKDHDQFVHFNHAHKEPYERTGIQGKHHSYISFVVDGEDHRTGRQKSIADPTGVRGASEKLSNVSHAIGHHIDKTVKPNMKKGETHYISYHASKEHDDSGRNPDARKQTYHKMAKRLMKRHGYKYHDTHEEPSGDLRYIYKSKSKKK